MAYLLTNNQFTPHHTIQQNFKFLINPKTKRNSQVVSFKKEGTANTLISNLFERNKNSRSCLPDDYQKTRSDITIAASSEMVRLYRSQKAIKILI